MATSAIDMSLDDYIKETRTSRRRGRGRGAATPSPPAARGGGAIRKKRTQTTRAEPYAKSPARAAVPPNMEAFRKVNITGLAASVTQADLLELFKSIGPVSNAQLFFDEKGRSKGTASVTFLKPGHAYRAYQEYHKRPLDNKVMHVELVVGNINEIASTTTKPSKPVRASPGGGRGRGRGGRRGGRGGGKRDTITAGQLDQDMDVYMGQGN